MLIESKIKRAKGTVVTLGTETYLFKPAEPNGPHIAEVKDPEHIDRLLAIPEGYRAVVDGRKPDPKPAEPENPAVPDPEPVVEPAAVEPEPSLPDDGTAPEPAEQPQETVAKAKRRSRTNTGE